MADATNIKNLIINAGNGTYQLSAGEGGGGDIYAELGVTPERFAELLGRDFYCPLMPEAPTESTLTYIDTDGSVNHFAIGQECRVPVDETSEYVFYKFAGVYKGVAVWLKLMKEAPIVKGVTDLSMQDIYGEPIAQTTANCYVVKKEGKYKFPLVFGNAIEKGVVNFPAFTNNGGEYSHDFVDYAGTPISSPYIEEVSGTVDSVQLSIADTDGVFTDMGISGGTDCNYVWIEVSDIPDTGANGVISVKDDSGVIMWSWHIWVWPHDLTPVEITNNTGVKYNILPVNLATKLDTADSINKTTGWKNWYYQWGRPTPMLCPAAYNSTDNHAQYGTLNYGTASKAASIQLGFQNPTTYYYNGSSPYNWFGTASYYNLWDANCKSTGNSDNNVVKTVYDPCPVGFKMPNGNTFTYFSTTNVVGSFSNGWYFKRNAEDTTGVFFPASGFRNYSNGSLNYVGSNGCVWLSSASSQASAYSLRFGSGDVDPQRSNRRAIGYGVRPVQE